MKFFDIQPNEESVRSYLTEHKTITGEQAGMIAMLFLEEDGFEIVDRLCEELGVEVTEPNYR